GPQPPSGGSPGEFLAPTGRLITKDFNNLSIITLKFSGGGQGNPGGGGNCGGPGGGGGGGGGFPEQQHQMQSEGLVW
ncbi:GSCOCG00004930001-RA-CDS, partial [Cotesia congregata]